MRYGKSMYRGGWVIDANTCDYESTRHLGIVCPFCSEAVHLKKGFEYVRDGKQITAGAAFCHYHVDDPVSKACELRSLRREGEEYIRNLEIQARNQRLELYNQRLWEFVRGEMEVKEVKSVRKVTKIVGNGNEWKFVNEEIPYSLSFKSGSAVQSFLEQKWLHENVRLGHRLIDEQLRYYQRWVQKLCPRKEGFDYHLNTLIFQEVLAFLGSATGFYTYERIFQATVIILCSNNLRNYHKLKNDVTLFGTPYLNTKIMSHLGQINWAKIFRDTDKPRS